MVKYYLMVYHVSTTTMKMNDCNAYFTRESSPGKGDKYKKIKTIATKQYQVDDNKLAT